MNKQELKNIIGEANLICDIGSYNGKDGLEYSRLFGCPVHCFEPDQSVFILNTRLFYWPVAVGASDEQISFYTSNHKQSASTKKPLNHLDKWPDVGFYEYSHCVNQIRLDTWYKTRHGRIIDLIHADVNGSEGDLIAGATEALKHTRYLYIEVSDKELYTGQPKINQVIAMLPDFKVIGLYDFGENFGNILFKNTKL